MIIWVDADACPNPIKEILFRAANRMNVQLNLVANHAIRTPPSKMIKSYQVAQGFDNADNHIAEHCQAGDLIISADIPLAHAVIEKGAKVIDPRGNELTEENIKARLTMRNFMEEMRNAGMATGGPPPLSQTDRREFANALDRFLARNQ
ncbi:MAG: YaiI/YqxD family protein [Pseudomonadales bacterium]|uniref:UPF0178 protein OLMES_0870 n=1 Tax=Oleiphilus messinensis TaxID=141451 RepID=A0A1Y0I3B8_9GAMM|nr:YaiI/YqxD family protein [Oleiphilus messinensis]ARU54957.1 hypothetical protein OLMES_0870 [Oleiphilus messinensis]MCG8610170.1 YaiI/YqxD family protein [Pseudomonadales bacterium]